MPAGKDLFSSRPESQKALSPFRREQALLINSVMTPGYTAIGRPA
jgi:hypothetical protein